MSRKGKHFKVGDVVVAYLTAVIAGHSMPPDWSKVVDLPAHTLLNYIESPSFISKASCTYIVDPQRRTSITRSAGNCSILEKNHTKELFAEVGTVMLLKCVALYRPKYNQPNFYCYFFDIVKESTHE